jgi:hypothetical protein
MVGIMHAEIGMNMKPVQSPQGASRTFFLFTIVLLKIPGPLVAVGSDTGNRRWIEKTPPENRINSTNQ